MWRSFTLLTHCLTDSSLHTSSGSSTMVLPNVSPAASTRLSFFLRSRMVAMTVKTEGFRGKKDFDVQSGFLLCGKVACSKSKMRAEQHISWLFHIFQKLHTYHWHVSVALTHSHTGEQTQQAKTPLAWKVTLAHSVTHTHAHTHTGLCNKQSRMCGSEFLAVATPDCWHDTELIHSELYTLRSANLHTAQESISNGDGSYQRRVVFCHVVCFCRLALTDVIYEGRDRKSCSIKKRKKKAN